MSLIDWDFGVEEVAWCPGSDVYGDGCVIYKSSSWVAWRLRTLFFLTQRKVPLIPTSTDLFNYTEWLETDGIDSSILLPIWRSRPEPSDTVYVQLSPRSDNLELMAQAEDEWFDETMFCDEPRIVRVSFQTWREFLGFFFLYSFGARNDIVTYNDLIERDSQLRSELEWQQFGF